MIPGGLTGGIYRADRGLTACWYCAACRERSWSEDKKNLALIR